MINEESTDCSEEQLQEIPEAIQDISLDEIVEAEYEVPPLDSKEQSSDSRRGTGFGRLDPPGRTRYDDSIDASSNDRDSTEQGYRFSAGFDSPAATRIGDENKDEGERLRELNEGRHHSDGRHSVREARRDKVRLPQAICTSFGLSEIEKMKVIGVVNQLDLAQFGQQKNIVKATLGTVAVLVDERLREIDDYEDCVGRSEEFQNVCDLHGISMSDMSTVKEIIRDSLNHGDVYIPQGKRLVKRDPDLPKPTLVKERPEEYWENVSPEIWEAIAKKWSKAPEKQNAAIPEKYKTRIEQLARWQPWEDDGEEPEEGPPARASSGNTQSVPGKGDDSSDVITEEVREEAEALVEEMEGEETNNE